MRNIKISKDRRASLTKYLTKSKEKVLRDLILWKWTILSLSQKMKKNKFKMKVHTDFTLKCWEMQSINLAVWASVPFPRKRWRVRSVPISSGCAGRQRWPRTRGARRSTTQYKNGSGKSSRRRPGRGRGPREKARRRACPRTMSSSDKPQYNLIQIKHFNPCLKSYKTSTSSPTTTSGE